VVHARTLEVLEQLDLTSRMLAEGVTVPVFTVIATGSWPESTSADYPPTTPTR
jgi:2-polyprenyl-6-methoxyphenol hydroxylase-like FAD-dependent oxidoreductase